MTPLGARGRPLALDAPGGVRPNQGDAIASLVVTLDAPGGLPPNQGDAIAPLVVTPDADAPRRYAEVSGDHNPIHLDPAAARAVGLPGPILHGLYTMAQVARCAVQAGGGRRLRRLVVDFRALGFVAEQIEVSGTVRELAGDRLVLSLAAKQGPRRVIRNATAELVDDE